MPIQEIGAPGAIRAALGVLPERAQSAGALALGEAAVDKLDQSPLESGTVHHVLRSPASASRRRKLATAWCRWALTAPSVSPRPAATSRWGRSKVPTARSVVRLPDVVGLEFDGGALYASTLPPGFLEGDTTGNGSVVKIKIEKNKIRKK